MFKHLSKFGHSSMPNIDGVSYVNLNLKSVKKIQRFHYKNLPKKMDYIFLNRQKIINVPYRLYARPLARVLPSVTAQIDLHSIVFLKSNFLSFLYSAS
mmetsp:Transcript_11352/g.10016  ORF Transcript_11352/g.10016 Transcript_11352/m.10016 type:complete len:98 (+) Transcript_11352:173-466(+)